MKHIYLAVWYQCNQKCLGCPVNQNENKDKSLTLEEIVAHLDAVSEQLQPGERVEVTISGGEPTLHPDFFEILEVLKRFGFYVALLTNADRFGNREFCDNFLKHVDIARLTVVTTIHGSRKEIHEQQNGTAGSFERSIRGLQYLSFRGVNVSVKHCITAENYTDTADFIRFVDDSFHPSVSIQLWGLDYAGLTREQAEKLYAPFSQMRDAIEDGLDDYLRIRRRNYRRLTLHNLPLCSIDPYYWELMPEATGEDTAYFEYFDPTTQMYHVGDESGKFSAHCADCAVNEHCCGAYRSLFEYFGDDAVAPVQAELLE